MRLTDRERSAITESIRALDPVAEVWLFGSRADDRARGGDIDLLVVSEVLSISDKIDILVAVKTQIGDQRIDIHILRSNQVSTDPLAQAALKTRIRL